MTPRFNSILVERLSEAVVSLNAGGDIVNFNSAARPLLRYCFDILPQVRQELRATGGTPPLLPRPLPLTPRLSHQGQPLETWLCENGTGFILLFLPAGNAVPHVAQNITTNSDLAFTSLIGAEIRHEIAALTEKMAAAEGKLPQEQKDFQQAAERLSRLLTVIDLLADTLQAPAFLESERLSLPTLLDEVLQQMPGPHGDYAINQELSDQPAQQGTLYGHAQWLKAAFRALLETLDANAPTHGQMELRIRQNGSFIVLTGGYRHLQHQPTKSRPAPSTPQQDPSAGGGGNSRTLRVDAGIRLAIARQIVELHGGQLRVLDVEGAPGMPGLIDGFTLVMPTGIPSQGRSPAICSQCIYPQQAKFLAQDLARLLPRPPLQTRMSPDELHLLAQLTCAVPRQDTSR